MYDFKKFTKVNMMQIVKSKKKWPLNFYLILTIL